MPCQPSTGLQTELAEEQARSAPICAAPEPCAGSYPPRDRPFSLPRAPLPPPPALPAGSPAWPELPALLTGPGAGRPRQAAAQRRPQRQHRRSRPRRLTAPPRPPPSSPGAAAERRARRRRSRAPSASMGGPRVGRPPPPPGAPHTGSRPAATLSGAHSVLSASLFIAGGKRSTQHRRREGLGLLALPGPRGTKTPGSPGAPRLRRCGGPAAAGRWRGAPRRTPRLPGSPGEQPRGTRGSRRAGGWGWGR